MWTSTRALGDLWTELAVTPFQWVPQTTMSLWGGWDFYQLNGVHSLAMVGGGNKDWPHSCFVALSTVQSIEMGIVNEWHYKYSKKLLFTKSSKYTECTGAVFYWKAIILLWLYRDYNNVKRLHELYYHVYPLVIESILYWWLSSHNNNRHNTSYLYQ